MRLYRSILCPAALVVLTLPTRLPAQDLPLELKGDITVVKVAKTVTVYEDRQVAKTLPVTVQAPKGHDLYFWTYPFNSVVANEVADGGLEIVSAPKGEFTVTVKAVKPKLDAAGKYLGFETKFGRLVVTVGDVPPGPTPPDPPKPDPPKPGPAPIAFDGLAVFVAFETNDSKALSKGAYNLIYSEKFRAYLESHCGMEADGKGKAYRIWDKDEKGAKDFPYWSAAAARPRSVVPWLVVSNPKTGVHYEGPIPADPAEVWSLLTKYGGP